MSTGRSLAGGGWGVAAAALIVGFFLYSRSVRVNAAWDKLSQAELFAYSGRVPEAQTLLTQITEEGGAPAASTMATRMVVDHFAAA